MDHLGTLLDAVTISSRSGGLHSAFLIKFQVILLLALRLDSEYQGCLGSMSLGMERRQEEEKKMIQAGMTVGNDAGSAAVEAGTPVHRWGSGK